MQKSTLCGHLAVHDLGDALAVQGHVGAIGVVVGHQEVVFSLDDCRVAVVIVDIVFQQIGPGECDTAVVVDRQGKGRSAPDRQKYCLSSIIFLAAQGTGLKMATVNFPTFFACMGDSGEGNFKLGRTGHQVSPPSEEKLSY